jgi:hypothetical protein
MELGDLHMMQEQSRLASERHGKHLALGALFDAISAYMDGRDNITVRERETLMDVRDLILKALQKNNRETALRRDMALCAARPADEEDDWNKVT